MRAVSLRRAQVFDALLIAAAGVVAAVSWARWISDVPTLNPGSVDSAAALAVCAVAVVLTLIVDDAWPAISVPPVIFGVTLAVCASRLVQEEGETLLAPWATLVLAMSALFWRRGMHFLSRAAVVVVGGQVLVLTQD
ncbi:MAG: hypothetical protein LBJ87_12855, partial [bacterium]|nr:hypothetical protein [bacterium]